MSFFLQLFHGMFDKKKGSELIQTLNYFSTMADCYMYASIGAQEQTRFRSP